MKLFRNEANGKKRHKEEELSVLEINLCFYWQASSRSWRGVSRYDSIKHNKVGSCSFSLGKGLLSLLAKSTTFSFGGFITISSSTTDHALIFFFLFLGCWLTKNNKRKQGMKSAGPIVRCIFKCFKPVKKTATNQS